MGISLKRGPWTPEEDQKLTAYIQEHGLGCWRSLPEKAGLRRCGKSCRLRWINYLRPDIRRGKFTSHEQNTIIQLHALLGNRWSAIASYLPNRTDNEIKNYWNTHIKKRLVMMGIDPSTHRPMVAPVGSANGDPKKVSNLTHMAQWESARLEAEARLVKESSKLGQNHLPPSGLKRRLPTQRFDKPRCLDILKAWQRVVDGNNGGNYNAGDLSNEIASFHSNEGLLQGCGDQTWNTGNWNADDQDLNLIKGYSNLVHANMDNDNENMSYWDEIFNLVDSEATSKS